MIDGVLIDKYHAFLMRNAKAPDFVVMHTETRRNLIHFCNSQIMGVGILTNNDIDKGKFEFQGMKILGSDQLEPDDMKFGYDE